MYKNQLQELAQRSCFNLPSYACIREGPDHAPRFKASVNFNGEIFEGPSNCTTLRQAEHAAAEVALNSLSRSLAAKVLDENGVYKNLLQETTHRAGLNLPVYTTVRSGHCHVPVFTSSVELAGMNFTGEAAKTKKQAEKNAAMAAWSVLKQMTNLGSSFPSNKESESSEVQEQVVVVTVLSNFKPKYENRPVRQRELKQGRFVRGYRDNNSGSSSQNSLCYRQWRSVDDSSDFSRVSPTHQQKQQQSCCLVLPPPFPTPSKILPPTSSRDQNHQSMYSSKKPNPTQVISRYPAKIKEIPAPLEEHQKDEEEWLNGKANVTEKSNMKNPSNPNSSSVFKPKPTYHRSSTLLNTPMLDHNIHPTQFRTRSYESPSMVAAPIGGITQGATPFQRIITGGFAPAVHVRSVIPVCASPHIRDRSSNSPTPTQMKVAPLSISALASTQTEQEVSEASSNLNNLQL